MEIDMKKQREGEGRMKTKGKGKCESGTTLLIAEKEKKQLNQVEKYKLIGAKLKGKNGKGKRKVSYVLLGKKNTQKHVLLKRQKKIMVVKE